MGEAKKVSNMKEIGIKAVLKFKMNTKKTEATKCIFVLAQLTAAAL